MAKLDPQEMFDFCARPEVQAAMKRHYERYVVPGFPAARVIFEQMEAKMEPEQWTVADHQHETQVELMKEECAVWQATRREQLERERAQQHQRDLAVLIAKAAAEGMAVATLDDRDWWKRPVPTRDPNKIAGTPYTRQQIENGEVLLVPAEQHRQLLEQLLDSDLKIDALGRQVTLLEIDDLRIAKRAGAALDLVDRFEIIARDLFQKTMKGGRIWSQCRDALAALEEFKHGPTTGDARPHALGDPHVSHGRDRLRPEGAGVGSGQLPGQDQAARPHGAAPEILCASCFHPCGPDGAALSLYNSITTALPVKPCPGCKGHHLLHVENRHRVHQGDFAGCLQKNGQVVPAYVHDVSFGPQVSKIYPNVGQVQRK